MILIVQSLQRLKQTVNICEEYSKEFDIQIKSCKSKPLCFNNKDLKKFSRPTIKHIIGRVDTELWKRILVAILIKKIQPILQQFHPRANYSFSDFSISCDVIKDLKDLHISYSMNMYSSELLNLNKSYKEINMCRFA